MIPVIEAYSSADWAFPKKDIDPKLKKEDYHRGNAEAIYSLFLRNRVAFTLSGYSDFANSREYSRGEQSIERYKSWLLNEELGSQQDQTTTSLSTFDDTAIGRVQKREGWANLMWQNVSPAPAILNAIHGLFDKADFDVYADTIDSKSKNLKEDQKFQKLFESQNLEWQNEYKQQAGIPIDENTVYPQSMEELAMYEAQGGFKSNVARAMQKLVRYSMSEGVSDWPGTIRKKVVDDLAVIGYGAVRDYYDPEDHKWKVKYIDPAKLVIQFSNEYDYKDSEYVGYFCTDWTISNLRNRLPDIPEERWRGLAHLTYSLYGNPRDRWDNFYSQLDPTTRTWRYDGFKVPVFEAEWVDTDIQNKLYYRSVHGRNSIIDVDWDYTEQIKELSPKAKEAGAAQEVKQIYKRVIRQCKWICYTKDVFDWGVVPMAARDGLSKPQLSFHVEQLLEPPLVKRMIPILDQISQLFLRWQNSLAMMIERGYAVNTSMLANVTYGAGKMKPAEVLKLWQQTGRLLFSYDNKGMIGQYGGGAALPVTPIEGGLGARVQETMEAMQMQFTLLEKMTGINLLSMSAPTGGTAVGVQEMATVATNNVLKPILDSVYEIKQSASTSLMRRIQIGIRNDKKIREAYEGVIGEPDMQAMIDMEAEGVQYGITLKPKPDAQMKADFVNWINIALQNTREQRPGIDINDAIHLKAALESGEDIFELSKQLQYKIEKNGQQIQAQTKANMQAQAQFNAQTKQAEQQGQMQLDNNLAQGKIAEEQMRGNVKANQTILEQNFEYFKQLKQAADAEQGILTPSSR